MKQEEIKEILKSHAEWLAGNGGKRADLTDGKFRAGRVKLLEVLE